MVQLGGYLRLPLEPLQGLIPLLPHGPHDLDGQSPFQKGILGQIHRPHGSLADGTLYQVSPDSGWVFRHH